MPPMGPPLTPEEAKERRGAGLVVCGMRRPPNVGPQPGPDPQPPLSAVDDAPDYAALYSDPDEEGYIEPGEWEDGGSFGGGYDAAQQRHGRRMARMTKAERSKMVEGLYTLAKSKK